MPENDDEPGRGYVTLQELRKYIMMAADEMSTSMKTYVWDISFFFLLNSSG